MSNGLQFVCVFCTGVFFGAALYISLVQQPAVIEAGASFAGRFFPSMYHRAARIQVPLAILGTVSGLWVWWAGGGLVWLVGALSLFAVVPFTLLIITPVNNQLFAAAREPGTHQDALIRRWGSLHAVRTVLSGLSFVAILAALVGG
ncbi:MAG: DUF1772 domain-containing protein [Candidatus Polarisedimenticolia bacterium]